MKKIISTLVIGVGLLSFSMNTNAATSNIKAGQVDTDGANLNIRSGASTNHSIIGKAADNTFLTIISSKDNFYYVEYQEDKYGYVSMDYVNVYSSSVMQVDTNGSNLNVRYGPSTSYYQFEKIKDQDYVIVLSNSGSFSNVLFEGNKVGYVSNDYLKTVSGTAQVNLNIVDYKQYDSRWAHLTLGTSGQNIKQIGCLTTAMAMSESYRTNTTKTPADIRNSSNYTSDGSLYWPSNYTTSQSSNYKSIIYNKLNQNKPVLIGLKTATGSQHWVIVTGYVEKNNLSLSNFIINDPTSTKTRLSQVVAKYPYFYKIAYYNN